jgi:hypothetical protein
MAIVSTQAGLWFSHSANLSNTFEQLDCSQNSAWYILVHLCYSKTDGDDFPRTARPSECIREETNRRE